MDQWEEKIDDFNELISSAHSTEYTRVHRETMLLFDLYIDNYKEHLPAPDTICPSSSGDIQFGWTIGDVSIFANFGIRCVEISAWLRTKAVYFFQVQHDDFVDHMNTVFFVDLELM